MGDQLLQSLLHELLQRVSGGRVPLPISQQQLQLCLVILWSPACLQYACRAKQGGSVRSSCGSSMPVRIIVIGRLQLFHNILGVGVRQCLLKQKATTAEACRHLWGCFRAAS